MLNTLLIAAACFFALFFVCIIYRLFASEKTRKLHVHITWLAKFIILLGVPAAIMTGVFLADHFTYNVLTWKEILVFALLLGGVIDVMLIRKI